MCKGTIFGMSFGLVLGLCFGLIIIAIVKIIAGTSPLTEFGEIPYEVGAFLGMGIGVVIGGVFGAISYLKKES